MNRTRALLLTALVLPLSASSVCAGEIVAWGTDNFGEVSNTPTGTGFAAIAAGGNTGYALAADGSISAWGSDTNGKISNAPTGTGFTAIAGDYANGYALTANGEILAWGNDSFDQVSNAPTGTGFTAIAAGGGSAYALAADGSIAAWGSGLGVSNAPTGSGFTAIAAGEWNGYALAADGSIAAWGADDSGQVFNTPTGTGFTAIAGGETTGYALAADGSIVAWGEDHMGLVSLAPTGTGFTAIAGAGFTGYALAADGSIVAWGEVMEWVSLAPTGTGFTAIAAGMGQGYALQTDPSLTAPKSAVSIRMNGVHVGGGTVIEERWVLTSAFIAYAAGGGAIPADPTQITVEAGNCTLGLGTVFDVEAVHFFDPDFNEPWDTTGDLALIKLLDPMPLGTDIQKASAIASSADNPGGNGQAVGWWRPCPSCPISETCLTLTLPILTDAEATAAWGPSPSWPAYQPASMLAIHDSTGLGGTFCSGGAPGTGVFSGGTLVGVASWGASDCGPTYPFVLARVGAFRAWIDDTIATGGGPVTQVGGHPLQTLGNAQVSIVDGELVIDNLGDNFLDGVSIELPEGVSNGGGFEFSKR